MALSMEEEAKAAAALATVVTGLAEGVARAVVAAAMREVVLRSARAAADGRAGDQGQICSRSSLLGAHAALVRELTMRRRCLPFDRDLHCSGRDGGGAAGAVDAV